MAEFLPGNGRHGRLVVVDPGVLGLGQYYDIMSKSSLSHGKFFYFFLVH